MVSIKISIQDCKLKLFRLHHSSHVLQFWYSRMKSGYIRIRYWILKVVKTLLILNLWNTQISNKTRQYFEWLSNDMFYYSTKECCYVKEPPIAYCVLKLKMVDNNINYSISILRLSVTLNLFFCIFGLLSFEECIMRKVHI